jgi:hypothetical protein
MNARLRSSGARLALAAAGLTFLLTFEFLRAWAVSMPLFFHGSLDLAKPLQGVLAFSPFVVAFVAAAFFLRYRPSGRMLVLLVAGLRMALQFVSPGVPRLIVVLIGLTACLCLLVALAPRRQVVLALVGALGPTRFC